MSQILIQKGIEKLLDDPKGAARLDADFVQGRIEGIQDLFGGAKTLKGRSRSLQLTFVNFSSQTLYLIDTHFESGTWFISPSVTIPKNSLCESHVANKQGGFMTGVTGGITFRIGESGKLFLNVGFCNPFAGGYKFFAEVSSEKKPAKYGYDNSFGNNPVYKQFNGLEISVTQVESQKSQMAFVYQLKNK